jgi:transcriptional regulator with XRE-family HTH domain
MRVLKGNLQLIELGQRIREMRKMRKLTQEDLAHESNIDRSYIGGVERGERNLTFTILCKIAAALKTDVASLTKNLPTHQR